MIEVQKILGKDRGVVAKQQILKETVIEIAPVSAIPAEHLSTLDKTEVFKYYFVRPAEYDESYLFRGYLVFGLASLCNHSDRPNAEVSWVEDEVGLWCHLIAQRDIEAGEEVTLFYTNIDEYSISKFI